MPRVFLLANLRFSHSRRRCQFVLLSSLAVPPHHAAGSRDLYAQVYHGLHLMDVRFRCPVLVAVLVDMFDEFLERSCCSLARQPVCLVAASVGIDYVWLCRN